MNTYFLSKSPKTSWLFYQQQVKSHRKGPPKRIYSRISNLCSRARREDEDHWPLTSLLIFSEHLSVRRRGETGTGRRHELASQRSRSRGWRLTSSWRNTSPPGRGMSWPGSWDCLNSRSTSRSTFYLLNDFYAGQVKIWFQNRRTKWKKMENVSNEEAARIMKKKLGDGKFSK